MLLKQRAKNSAPEFLTRHYDLEMIDPKRKNGPHCPIHPDTALICPACIAAVGGRATSPAKIAASRENAKLATEAASKARRRKKRRKAKAKKSTRAIFFCEQRGCSMRNIPVERPNQSPQYCDLCKYVLTFRRKL